MGEPISFFYEINKRIEELYDQKAWKTHSGVSKVRILIVQD